MPRIDPRRTDLVNAPLEQAERLAAEEAQRIYDMLVPRTRLRPTTQWLHDRGITLKDLLAEDASADQG